MAKVKIFNDPVYGFITVPSGILLDLIEHPYFQRLQRIKQLGLSHYVYPGAVHSRFHHALGAYHLMTQALNHLRLKAVPISDAEYQSAQIAILLHDIGHGPFSHVLEHSILPIHHEEITSLMMQQLNVEFNGALDLAIRIFNNRYDRPFLHQLISGQLDTDRLDYLTRDSFFTGVAEGVVGYDRLLLMMDVVDQRLVLEEKAIYSIEKFLSSRKIMYMQVYMHKTALAAEYMLNLFLKRCKEIRPENLWTESLRFFFQEYDGKVHTAETFLPHYSKLDDIDIWSMLKDAYDHEDPILQYLSRGLLDRKLFKIQIRNQAFHPTGWSLDASKGAEEAWVAGLRTDALQNFHIQPYDPADAELMIRMKSGALVPFSNLDDMSHLQQKVERYYFVEPRLTKI